MRRRTSRRMRIMSRRIMTRIMRRRRRRRRLRSLPKLLKLLLEQHFMLSKITINNVIILDQILLDLQVIWHLIMSLLWVPSVSISFFVLFVVSDLIYTNS